MDLSWEEKKFFLRTAPVLSARQQHTLLELLENHPGKKVSEIVNAMNGVWQAEYFRTKGRRSPSWVSPALFYRLCIISRVAG